RCWGSISSASRGEMRKNKGSNLSTSSRKAPRCVYILPGTAGSASKKSSTGQRSAGTSRMASRPSRSSCQKAAGLGPPGKRQLMPTMAIGSISRLLTAIDFACPRRQVLGHQLDGRIIPYQRRRQRAPEPPLQLSGEADSGSRVESVVAEGLADVDLL